jgi:hypothetical protein
MLHVELALRLTLGGFRCVQRQFRERRCCSARQNGARFTRDGVVARTFRRALAALSATAATATPAPATLAPFLRGLGRGRTFGQHAGGFHRDVGVARLVIEARPRDMIGVRLAMLVVTRLLATGWALVTASFAPLASTRLARFAGLAGFASTRFAWLACLVAARRPCLLATLTVAARLAARFTRVLVALA